MKYDFKKQLNKRKSLEHLRLYKPIQRQYFIWMIIVTIFTGFALSIVVHHTVADILAQELARTSKVSIMEVLNIVEQEILIRIFLVVLVTVLIAAWSSIFFLRKVVGPIFRIQSVLKRTADGHTPKNDIKLRTGDFFSEVAQELNRVLAKIRKIDPDFRE